MLGGKKEVWKDRSALGQHWQNCGAEATQTPTTPLPRWDRARKAVAAAFASR